MKDIHVHKFKKKAFKKVLLRGPDGVSGKDKLLVMLCECGAEQPYDIEREYV